MNSNKILDTSQKVVWCYELYFEEKFVTVLEFEM
jgi:hypothetical protein